MNGHAITCWTCIFKIECEAYVGHVSTYQLVQKYRLAITIGLSLSVHTWLLVGFVVERPVPLERSDDTLFVELSLIARVPALEDTPVEEPDTPDAVAEPEEEEEVVVDEETVQEELQEAVSDLEYVEQLEEALPTVEDLRSSLSSTLSEGGFATYVGPTCTEAERASEIRLCGPRDLGKDDRTRFYANLFREAFGHVHQTSPSFDKDMDRVATLAARSERLVALNPDDPVEEALLREQRAYLREEILRIDKRYTQFNLLKLVPIGRRVVEGLKERVGEQ